MLPQVRNVGVAVLVGSMAMTGVSALSAQCTTQIGLLALGGDLGNCLALSSVLSVFSSSQPLTTSLASYLNTLCSSSTPTCSNATLSSAQDTVRSACSSDLSAGGTDATTANALLQILQSYPEVRNAGCIKTSGNNTYCLINSLEQVSAATGQNVTTSSLLGLLTSSSDTVSQLGSLANSGSLCTDCNAAIYYEAKQANQTVASSSVGQAIESKCGSSFGQSIPASIDQSQTANDTSASSPSASGASASPSGAAAGLTAGSSLGLVAGSAFVAVLGGAGLVLA